MIYSVPRILGMKSKNWFFLAFLVGSGFILLFNLWGRHLENHDFLRHAEIAREMIRSGDWIVPRFNGEIYVHKPPFLFWLIALPSSIYGSVTPFLARLPAAFFAWIGALVVYLWGRKIWGEDRDGLIGAGILISSYLYFHQGRIARSDMVFSILILLSLYSFYLSYQREKRYGFSILCCVFMAMAGLTKGPIGVIFPILIIVLFLLRQRKLRLLVQKEFLLGYLVAIFLFSLWMIPFIHRVTWDSALSVWQETRILTRQAPFYVYGHRIWANFAPWSIFLPFLIVYYWKKAKSRDEEFLILWFISLFVILTIFPVRNSRYLLPAFPALALLMGGFLRKRSLSLFYVIFFGAILVWHGYEYNLIKKNEIRKPGSVLFQEFQKYRDKDIIGYQMDIGILGTINFYEDRVISQTKHVEDLKKKAKGIEEIFVVTTERGLQDLIKEDFLVTWSKKIDHREGSIFLVKTRYVKGM
jgi:4-amino-4-deoxy-L-arabinose transferase-like glycosyltransferase